MYVCIWRRAYSVGTCLSAAVLRSRWYSNKFIPTYISDIYIIYINVYVYVCIYIHTCTLLFKSNGIFLLRWQNMVFIFKVQTWNFVCGIRRYFALTMENILSVWYTATPGWTSKFGKVWKTRCQNAATRAIIWRCFLVSWDDKYLWVMVSNNRHELYFCSK